MKPLQAIAMGLVIVALDASVNGYDLLADPLGWLLVINGAGRLPHSVRWRDSLPMVGLVAFAVSAILWFPGVRDALGAGDGALAWAASLPELVFTLLVCLALAPPAAAGGDLRARSWLLTAATLVVAVSVLPAVVIPTVPDLLGPILVLALVTIVLIIVLLFAYSSRPWAQQDDPAEATAR